MKSIKISILLFIALIGQRGHAQQASFLTSGTIEYSKSVNMYALMAKLLTGAAADEILGRYKNANPQFQISKSNLSFSQDKSFLRPVDGPAYSSFSADAIMAAKNTVYSDFKSKRIIASKDVMGETFLLKDSLRNIRWKITDETRDILGYPCRRANAIVLDSVYVVAFFTTNIPVSGGPESFCGLPGMILQLALPRENVSWIATKIDTGAAPALSLPAKGKDVNWKTLEQLLQSSMERYPPVAKAIYLKAMLL